MCLSSAMSDIMMMQQHIAPGGHQEGSGCLYFPHVLYDLLDTVDVPECVMCTAIPVGILEQIPVYYSILGRNGISDL